jgi:chromosome segregation ATPase
MIHKLFNKTKESRLESTKLEVKTLLMDLNWVQQQLESVDNQISAARTELNQKNDLLDKARNSKLNAKKELDQAQAQLKQFNGESQSIQQQLGVINLQLEHQRHLKNQLEEDICKKNALVNEQKTYLAIRLKEVEKSKQDQEKLTQTIAEVELEIKQISDELIQLEKITQASQVRMNELEEQRKKVQVSLTAKDDKKGDLLRKINHLENNIAQREAELSSKTNQYQDISKSRDELNQRLSDLESQNLTLEKKLQATVFELQQAENDQNNLGQKIYQLNLTVQNYQFEIKQNRDLYLKLSEQKKSKLEQLENLRIHQEKIKNELSHLQQENQKINNELDSLEANYQLVLADVDRFQSLIEEKRLIFNDKNDQITQLKQKNVLLTNKRTQLIEQAAQLERVNAKNIKLFDLITDGLEKKEVIINDLTHKLEKLSSENVHLEAELTQLRSQRKDLNLKMQQKLGELSSLEEELANKRSEKEYLLAEKSSIFSEIDQLEQQIINQNDQIAAIRQKILLSKNQFSNEVNLIERYNSQLEDLNKDRSYFENQLRLESERVKEISNQRGDLLAQVKLLDRDLSQLHNNIADLAFHEAELVSELKQLDIQLGDLKQQNLSAVAKINQNNNNVKNLNTVLEEKKQACKELQTRLNVALANLEQEKSSVTSIENNISLAENRYQSLLKVFNGRDNDLNALREEKLKLEAEHVEKLESIKILENQNGELENLISNMLSKRDELIDSKGRMDKVLSGIQKKFNQLKQSYQELTERNKTEEIEIKKQAIVIKNTHQSVKDLQLQIDQLKVNKNHSSITSHDVAVTEDTHQQYLQSAVEMCAQMNVDFKLDDEWYELIKNDEHALLIYNTSTLYTRYLKAAQAQISSAELFKLEKFSSKHFIFRLHIDQFDKIVLIKDIFAKASNVLKMRANGQSIKIAHKAHVELGKIVKIDIIVKYEENEKRKPSSQLIKKRSPSLATSVLSGLTA